MADIKTHLNNIKGALYGKDVRGSIHDGIDAINTEVENTTGRQVDLENTFDQLVINAGNSNAEIVDARVKSDGTSYSKLGDRLDSVDSQLAHIVDNGVSINKWNKTGLSDSERIEKAIDYCIENNKTLILNGEIEIERPIKIKNNLHINGVSKYTTKIIPTSDFSGDSLIEEFNNNVSKYSIKNISLYCNNIVKNGLNVELTGAVTTGEDCYYTISDIFIKDSLNDGLRLKGRGEYICNNIQVIRCGNNGVVFDVWDSSFTNISAGLCKNIGVYIDGSPNKLTNCKSWGCKIGYDVNGILNNLSNCEAQENTYRGFLIKSKNSLYDITIDGVGRDFYNDLLVEDSCAIEVTSQANNIRANISNNIFNANYPTSMSYFLKCSGGYNNVSITGSHATKGAVYPDSDFTSNIIEVTGSSKTYTDKNTQRFINPDLKCGVELGGSGGDSGNSSVGYLYPVDKDGSINTNLGIELHKGMGVRVKGCLLPRTTERDIGWPTDRWDNIYLKNSPNVSSKRELKENIKLFNDDKAYNDLKSLPIYTYNFKNGNGENMLGSMYDELPTECLDEKAQGVDLYAYTSFCISALKKAIEKIEELENKIK